MAKIPAVEPLFEENGTSHVTGNSQETAPIVPLSDDQPGVEVTEAQLNSPPRINKASIRR